MDDQQGTLKLQEIPGWNRYYCSTDGRIFSVKRRKSGRQLNPCKHKARGGIYMRIKIDGRFELLHRVLASVHVGRRLLSEECVNHKDGNRLNNNLDNLEVVTAKENFAHAVANGLYCSGPAWYAARGLQEPSTTIPKGSRGKRPEARGTHENG